MANYTMTVYDIERNESFFPNGVFNFNYNFYTDDKAIKELFEKQFLEYYQFHEIGFETVYRFQLALKAHLDCNADYWRKLYYTELRSQDLDFMSNKDYTETIERVLDQDTTNQNTNNSTSNSTNEITNESSSNSTNSGSSTVNGSSTSNSTNSGSSTVNSDTTSTSSGSGTSNVNSKGSDTNNGVAYISTDNGSLTTASVSDSTNTNTANSSIANTNEASTNSTNETTNTNTSTNTNTNTNETTNNSTSNSTSNNTSKGTSNDVGTNDERETTTIHGVGNIGVTSAADLLTGWRSVLISMNLLIIESCKDLFMQIY